MKKKLHVGYTYGFNVGAIYRHSDRPCGDKQPRRQYTYIRSNSISFLFAHCVTQKSRRSGANLNLNLRAKDKRVYLQFNDSAGDIATDHEIIYARILQQRGTVEFVKEKKKKKKQKSHSQCFYQKILESTYNAATYLTSRKSKI